VPRACKYTPETPRFAWYKQNSGRGEGLIYNIPAPDFQIANVLTAKHRMAGLEHAARRHNQCVCYNDFALNAAVVLCGPSGAELI
jgi:hypothetical protein